MGSSGNIRIFYAVHFVYLSLFPHFCCMYTRGAFAVNLGLSRSLLNATAAPSLEFAPWLRSYKRRRQSESQTKFHVKVLLQVCRTSWSTSQCDDF